jgi:hypothetical protein
MFIVQPDTNLQCRLLFDGPFHPQGLSWRVRCRRRGFTSQWRGPRHGDSNICGGRRSRSLLFRLGPGGRGGRTTSGYYQHVTISTYSYTTKQQVSTRKIRVPVPFACALPDVHAAPRVEFRSTPWLVQGSCSILPLLQLPSPPGGPRPPWSRCYAEPGLCEPSLLRQRRWGGGGPAGGCRVAAGSCGIVLCVPAEGFQLAVAEQSSSSTKSSRILTGLVGFHMENNAGT